MVFLEVGIPGSVFLCLGLLFAGLLGAAHQPDTTEDEGHAEHHIRQPIHHQIKCPEHHAVPAPAPQNIVQEIHNDVLVGDQRAKGDEGPAHQLVAVQQKPGKALVLGVQVDQIVIRRGIAQGDLRPEVEGIKKAVHKNEHQKKRNGGKQHRQHADDTAHQHQRKAPFHIALVHLACAGDERKQQGQQTIFQHNKSSHSQVTLCLGVVGIAPASGVLPGSRFSSTPESLW